MSGSSSDNGTDGERSEQLIYLAPDKTFTLQQLISDKCVPHPHSVNDKWYTLGQTLAFINVSGTVQHLAVLKGNYKIGQLLTSNPQAEYVLENGQCAFQKVHGSYSFTVNWVQRGHSKQFNKESARYIVKEYCAFNVRIVNGELSVVGTTFNSQENGILYWFIDELAPELEKWSINVHYNDEFLKRLEPTGNNIYVSSQYNKINPNAFFKMEDDYTVYMIEQEDPIKNQMSQRIPKYKITSDPFDITPGYAFVMCVPDSEKTGAIGLETVQIGEIIDPSAEQIPTNGGGTGYGGVGVGTSF